MAKTKCIAVMVSGKACARTATDVDAMDAPLCKLHYHFTKLAIAKVPRVLPPSSTNGNNGKSNGHAHVLGVSREFAGWVVDGVKQGFVDFDEAVALLTGSR